MGPQGHHKSPSVQLYSKDDTLAAALDLLCMCRRVETLQTHCEGRPTAHLRGTFHSRSQSVSMIFENDPDGAIQATPPVEQQNPWLPTRPPALRWPVKSPSVNFWTHYLEAL